MIWWKETESFLESRSLPFLSLMTSLILKPSFLIKELWGEHDSLISLSVLEPFLLAFEGGVPSTWKQGLSVVPKTPQVLSKPVHSPKLAPRNILGEGWGRALGSAFLPGVSDTTHHTWRNIAPRLWGKDINSTRGPSFFILSPSYPRAQHTSG